ncbi:MAG: M48 family metallopeptidase [Planctomycetaceae bacterium]|jgi:Zn-dependent protease with chaperone function|nr:M48 family metallopeptidase [Planctomycetaceae bacterium]
MTTNFFSQQDRARRKTKWLVFYYILAVVLTITAVYALFLGIFVAAENYQTSADMVQSPIPAVGVFNLPLLFFVTLGVVLVIGGGTLFKTRELSSGGGKTVAELLGGTKVLPNTADPAEKRLLNVVEETAIASGVPVPAVYLLHHDRGINAFAAGFSENEAVIGVTQGTMELLDRDELQGVIAHEFSHILNGDMRLNIRLIGVLFGLQVVAWLGWLLFRYSYLFTGSRGSRDRNGNSSAPLGLAMMFFGLGLAVIGAIGVFFGSLIKAAISRQREFLADASAVQFTRNPQGIAGALKKIGTAAIGSAVSSVHAVEASHLFISIPIRFQLFNLFSTHPPLAERIKRIDPSFDGKFPQTLNRAVDYYEHKRNLEQQQPRQAAFSRALSSQPMTVTATVMLDSIGQLDLTKLSVARDLLAEIPDSLRQKAYDTDGAQTLVYALLTAEEPEVRRVQWDYLSQKTVPALFCLVRETMDALKPLPVSSRFPLLEIVFPTLKTLTADHYRLFRENVIFLVNADHTIDLFEYTLQAKLLRELDIHFGLSKPPVVKYHSVQAVLPQQSVVLSYLAYLGHNTLEEADQAYQLGLGVLMKKPRNILPQSECTATAFDAALRQLSCASPAVKQKVIQSFVTCVAADGKVTLKEGEILRAITAMLGCPMPPLG